MGRLRAAHVEPFLGKYSVISIQFETRSIARPPDSCRQFLAFSSQSAFSIFSPPPLFHSHLLLSRSHCPQGLPPIFLPALKRRGKTGTEVHARLPFSTRFMRTISH